MNSHVKNRIRFVLFAALFGLSEPIMAMTITSNFTGNSAKLPWVSLGGACLLAGNSQTTGTIPACINAKTKPTQVPVGKGALRLTANTGGQSGAIVYPVQFPSNDGLQVTFTSYTFGGSQSQNAGTGNVKYSGTTNLNVNMNTGADGIGFYIINGDELTNITYQLPRWNSSINGNNGRYATIGGWDLGAFGGSLGYQCSNTNQPYNGMPGAYLGLGIDEYGNFVNGSSYATTNHPNGNGYQSVGYGGDNTDSGPGLAPNSIAMRGYGNLNDASIAQALNAVADPHRNLITAGDIYWGTNDYPIYWLPQHLCEHGGVFDRLSSGTISYYVKGLNTIFPSLNLTTTEFADAESLPDYQYLPGSFHQLPTSQPISDPTATTLSTAIPISYKITITPAGLLSLSYSYNGGAYTSVISDKSINNGTEPSNFLFGFGASTGGSWNNHDITCFKAQPAGQSSSSASVNVQQTGELQTNSQVFLAYYSPDNWWGKLTAQQIQVSPTNGAVTVNPDVNWNAACFLTGGVCSSAVYGSTYATSADAPTSAQAWSSIPIFTWKGSTGAGIPFNWSSLGSGSNARTWLDTAEPGYGQELVHYLKGDANPNYQATSYSLSNTTTPQFRIRTSILGDIINSSPTWVGGPDEGLPDTFSNALNPTATYAENASSAQTYSAFASAESGRLNVVYVGANDGLLHGFAAGSYTGTTFNNSTNNGQEVFAYVPYAVLESFGSTGQYPQFASNYASPNYGHSFYVNATPATGDVFYGEKWHTLLVGALGTGGRGLYALNITHPKNFTSSDTGAVLADYTFADHGQVPTGAVTPNPPNFTSVNGTGTVANNTYEALMGEISGKPIIRLMNNGDYAIISGDGTNSDDGEAGIFIFLISPSATGFTISKTIFLGTGTRYSTTPDGIDYVSSAALNGDHFADYLYAGDTDGNVWRFNVTGDQSSDWHVSYYGNGTPTPLFKTGSSSDPQPITTRILVDTAIAPNGTPQVMLQFGTGSTTPLTNTSAATYATTPQAIYDIWDGGLSAWNSGLGSTYNAWSSSDAPELPLQASNLAENTISSPGTVAGQTVYANNAAGSTVNAVTLTSAPVCWGAANGGTCTSTNIQYGSYEDLPQAPTNGQTLYQQVTYNPAFIQGAAVFDTTIPPYVDAYDCNNGLQGGYTYAFNPLTGGAIANGFFRSSGTNGAAITLGGVVVSGLQLNATGSPTVVSANGNPVMVQQTVSGNPVATEVFPAGGMGSQVNWIELR